MKRILVFLIGILFILPITAFATENTQIGLKGVEDQSWKETYENILKGEIPIYWANNPSAYNQYVKEFDPNNEERDTPLTLEEYQSSSREYLTNYGNEITYYINDFNSPVKFALIWPKQSSYPLLILNIVDQDYLSRNIMISYKGQGEYKTDGYFGRTPPIDFTDIATLNNNNTIIRYSGDYYGTYQFVDGVPVGDKAYINTDNSYNPDTWVKRPVGLGGVNENNEYVFIEKDSSKYHIKDYAMDPAGEEKVSSEEFNNLFAQLNFINLKPANLISFAEDADIILKEKGSPIEKDEKEITDPLDFYSNYGWKINENYQKNNSDLFRFTNISQDFFKQDDLWNYSTVNFDYKKHIQGLSPYLLSFVEDYEQSEWTGSCYGVSLMGKLMKDGYQFKEYDTLEKVPFPINNKEIKDTIQTLQTSYLVLQPLEYYDNKEFLPDFYNELKKGNDYIVLNYYLGDTDMSHAVLTFGLEEGIEKKIEGKTYTKRVPVKDPNVTGLRNFYFNDDFTESVYMSEGDSYVEEYNPRFRSFVSKTQDAFYSGAYQEISQDSSKDWIESNHLILITNKNNSLTLSSQGEEVKIEDGKISGERPDFLLSLNPMLEDDRKIRILIEKDDFTIEGTNPVILTIVSSDFFGKVDTETVNFIQWSAEGKISTKKEGEIVPFDEEEKIDEITEEIIIQNQDEKISINADDLSDMETSVEEESIVVVDNNDQKDYIIKSERLGEEEKEYVEMEVTNEDKELKITTNDGVLEVSDEQNEIIQDANFEQPGFPTIGYLFIAVFIIAVILLGKILFDRKG